MVVNHKVAPKGKVGRIWAALDVPSYQHCETHGNELDRLFGMEIPSTVWRLEDSFRDDRKMEQEWSVTRMNPWYL